MPKSHELAHFFYCYCSCHCYYFFLQLEPEHNGTEILNALKYVRPGNGFVPNFQMFKMVDVNGKNEIALYTYLKVSCYPKIKHEYVLINISIKEILVSLRMIVKNVKPGVHLRCIDGLLGHE